MRQHADLTTSMKPDEVYYYCVQHRKEHARSHGRVIVDGDLAFALMLRVGCAIKFDRTEGLHDIVQPTPGMTTGGSVVAAVSSGNLMRAMGYGLISVGLLYFRGAEPCWCAYAFNYDDANLTAKARHYRIKVEWLRSGEHQSPFPPLQNPFTMLSKLAAGDNDKAPIMVDGGYALACLMVQRIDAWELLTSRTRLTLTSADPTLVLIGDLVERTRYDLLRLSNVGQKGLAEVIGALANVGLRLRGENATGASGG